MFGRAPLLPHLWAELDGAGLVVREPVRVLLTGLDEDLQLAGVAARRV